MSNNRTGNDTGSQQINSQFRTYKQNVSKGTQIIQNVLLPRQVINLPIPGAEFYFPALSGQIKAAVIGSFGKDVSNPYYAGTGLKFDIENAFSAIELENPDLVNNLFFQMVAGFDNYIDNRLTFPSIQYKQISKQAYWYGTTPLTNVPIVDISGTLFTADDGLQYYAVNRQQITFFNVSDDTEFWFVTNVAENKWEAIIASHTTIQLPMSGNFHVTQDTDGSVVQGLISEIYNCLPKV